MSTFWTNGPLPPDHPFFLGREIIITNIQNHCKGEVKSYIAIFGSRHTGKTSLYLRLMHLLEPTYLVCRIDLQRVAHTNSSFVFGFIGRTIKNHIPQMSGVNEELTSTQLSEFLLEATKHLTQEKIILLFEEFGSLTEDTAKKLANLIRSWFNERFDYSRQEFGKVLAIVAGSDEMYDLVSQRRVSPLENITTKFYLNDLKLYETSLMFENGLAQFGLPQDETTKINKDIFDIVSGHPYLTQLIGSKVYEKLAATEAKKNRVSVDIKLITHAISQDNWLLRYIKNRVEEYSLTHSLPELLSSKIRYNRTDKEMALLELIGLAKEREGVWVPRNKLFEQEIIRWLR